MPYAPGIQYRGDQYLYDSISSFGRGVGSAIKEYRDTKEKSQAADAAFEAIASFAAPMVQDGTIGPEFAKQLQDASKFSGLSATAKQSKLGEMVSGIKMLMDRKQQAANEDLARWNLKLRGEELQAFKSNSSENQRLGWEGLLLRGQELEAHRKNAEDTLRLNQNAQDMRSNEVGKIEDFGRRIAGFMSTPSVSTVPTPIGPVGVPQRPRLTAQDLARFAAEAGILDASSAANLMREDRDQFMPQVIDSGGVKMVTTSRGSAVPLSTNQRTGDPTYDQLTDAIAAYDKIIADSFTKEGERDALRSARDQLLKKRQKMFPDDEAPTVGGDGGKGAGAGAGSGVVKGRIMVHPRTGRQVRVPEDQVKKAEELGYK